MWGDEKEDGAKPLRQPEEVCLLFARESPALANMDPKTQREIACEKKLQNRQLPYKESKGKNFAGPPLATKQDGKNYVSATPQAGVLRRIITA